MFKVVAYKNNIVDYTYTNKYSIIAYDIYWYTIINNHYNKVELFDDDEMIEEYNE